MAASFLFNRVSALFQSVAETLQLSEYFSENSEVVEFPMNTVLKFQGEETVAPNLAKDVESAYSSHTKLRIFTKNTFNAMEQNKEVLIKIIRTAKDPVEAIVSFIFLVAKERREKDVDFLLKLDTFSGAPIDFQQQKIRRLFSTVFESGCTIIHHVVLNTLDNRVVLQSLLNYVESPEVLEKRGGPRGFTPLLLAAFSGSKWAITPLVDAGMDVSATDAKMNNVLHLASASMRDGVSGGEIIDALFSARKDTMLMVNEKNSDGHTPVSLAAANGDVGALKVLLSEGASAKSSGYSPLCYAVLAGSLDSVKLLLEHGANVNDRSREGLAAISIAARNGDLEIMRTLLAKEHDASIMMTTFKEALSNRKLKCANCLALKTTGTISLDAGAALREVVLLNPKDFGESDVSLYTDLVKYFVQTGGLGDSGFAMLRLAAQRDNTIAVNVLLEAREWTAEQMKAVSELSRNAETVQKITKKIEDEQNICVCCFDETEDLVKFSPCNHIECCKTCFADLKRTSETPHCPTCRVVLDIPNCKPVNG